ncbi:MAG: C45 family peptidase [Vicingaceae bacterium]
MLISLKCVAEEEPGEKWQKRFNKSWPYYKKWFLSEGHTARAGYLTCLEQLQEHMPELVPIYEELCELAGGSDLAARYLSLYNPPPFMSGCTQVAWNEHPYSLIRNYDYNPKWFEGTLFKTNWLKPVIGMSDCNWGLLDGMNADGLAISLTFGGRKISGEGFGIPLIMRYVLETCKDVPQAVSTLLRLPVHMSYNVTVLDKTGKYKTVYLTPDKGPHVDHQKVATNHQQDIEWLEYAELTATKERKSYLDSLVAQDHMDRDQLRERFLAAPLYNKDIQKSFVTLYGAQYDLEALSASIFWPGKLLEQSFEHFNECREFVNISKPNTGEFTAYKVR